MIIPQCRFQVGDRVIVTADSLISNKNICRGYTGTVCHIPGVFSDNGNVATYLVGVNFDEPVHNGHACDGSCRKGYGWYIRDYEIARLVDIERDYVNVEVATDEELFAFLGVK